MSVIDMRDRYADALAVTRERDAVDAAVAVHAGATVGRLAKAFQHEASQTCVRAEMSAVANRKARV